ncbi:MAG: pentapeptide repeat-containing protein [Polyangiaceae bacterium]
MAVTRSQTIHWARDTRGPPVAPPDRCTTSNQRRPRSPPSASVPSSGRGGSARAKLGTYDDRWARDRWPDVPPDFDWSYWNAAPPDQQLDWLRGDERFAWEGADREHRIVEGALPCIRPRCFVRKSGDKAVTEEVILHLDTAAFDMDQRTVTLLFRGLYPIATRDGAEIEKALLVTERLADAPKDASVYLDEAYWAPSAASADLLADISDASARDAPVQMPEPLPPRNEPDPEEIAMLERERQVLREGGVDPAILARLEGVTSAAVFADILLSNMPAPDAPDAPGTDAPQTEAGTKDELHEMREELRAGGVDPAVLERLEKETTRAGFLAVLFAAMGTDSTAEKDEAREIVDAMKRIEDDADAQARVADAKTRSARGERLTVEEVVRLDAAGESLEEANLTGLDLSGKDLRGANFTRAVFDATKLRGTNLSGCDCTGARLTGADLSGARLERTIAEGAIADGASFEGAILTDANFSRSRLAGARFDAATLKGTDLVGSALDGASFVRASLDDARFEGAALSRARFDGAEGARTSFRAAQLNASSFDGAKLPAARLSGAELSSAIFDRAALREAHFDGSRCDGASFAGTDLTGARFDGASGVGAKLKGVIAPGSNWSDTSLRDADFEAARLDGALFVGASLERASFHRTHLSDANLQGAILGAARLTQAKLFRARLRAANLRGADLRGASLFEADLFASDTTGARLDHANVERTLLTERRVSR